MTATSDSEAALDAAPTVALSQLAAWHLAWTIVVILGGVAVYAAAGGLSNSLLTALGAGLLPGLFVLLVRPGDGAGSRLALLGLWAICGAAAGIVTGGMGGPMAVWCLAPMALAGALGRRGSAGAAAGFSFLAMLAVVVAQLTGFSPAAPAGLPAFALGLTAIIAMALGVGASLVIGPPVTQATTPAPAPPETAGGLHNPLAAYPGKVLVIEPDGAVKDSHGRLAIPTLEPGGTFTMIARPEDRVVLADAAAAARGGTNQTVVFTPADDPLRRFSLDLAMARDGLLVGVVRDATASHDREQALELARADAENLAAGRARFLAGMSHELRTPLNAIMGFSDIMRNKMFGELPGKYAEYADLIHESGAHLLDLINDVLDMSKIEAHRYELNKEFMDAREPVSAALRILRVQADDAGVKLRATLPSQPLEVDADRRALKQIVINLVSNALKFTPRDGSVIVGLIARGKDLDLTVADTGIGIAPDDVARLGRPYEQAGDVVGRSKGTGLGLSLVRAFAELHGGQMIIESRLGEGTAVTVTMPVVVVDDSATPPGAANVVAFKPQR